MHVELLSCEQLDRRTIDEMAEVLSRSFACDDPHRVLAQYGSTIDHVFVARSERRVVGFQFYRRKDVEGRDVHHFSLAGRLPEARYRGLQGRFGTELVRRAVTRTVPWRQVFLAGVANNPKSYANMHVAGGRIYPDVLRPAEPNPFGNWYSACADALGMQGVRLDGVLPGRMKALGMDLVVDHDARSPLLTAYADYVDGNLEDGIFTVVSLVPARDLPPYLAGQARRRVLPRSYRSMPVRRSA